jgi:hypothetical protein
MNSAIREFGAGNYTLAAGHFEQYLNLAPAASERDKALFHLGLIYALPGDSRQDWQRAEFYLSQLVSDFPVSPLRTPAQLILSLHAETLQLTAETERRDQSVRQLNSELEQREQAFRQLNIELQRLIKIDSERRPRP